MTKDPGRSLLTRGKILEHAEAGDIVIRPFNEKNVKTTSYDVRLGKWHFRKSRSGEKSRDGLMPMFNPFRKEEVDRYWGTAIEAEPVTMWRQRGYDMDPLPDAARVIVLYPLETILAHTVEFIGGRTCVSTEMRARSTMGRIGVTICKCAGWGDLGYINRWTMEITNHNEDACVPLVVGMRLGQIIFYKVDPLKESYAAEHGKYQTSDQIDEIMRSWRPEAMLPKLYKDDELVTGFPADDVVDKEKAA
ncbi:deoxycytidine triphosphate deaminase [Patescibacteria group bacterium]|nr:MAG: deoxycytidine triphosphate deaminase [Patescibacteria group bacterium]